jgi:acyl carrier protein
MDAAALRAIIAKLALCRPDDLQPDTPLLSSGLLDSTALLELVVTLERRTGVKVKPGDMTLKYFDSIGRILDFLQRARSG